MRNNPNNQQRMCVVRDIKTGNSIVEAIVVDAIAHRVRLQTGEHFGEARKPGEYELLDFVRRGQAPQALAAEVAETNDA